MSHHTVAVSEVEDQAALRNRGLPKWPQMLVTGVPVTVEQAKEVIRRTDTFFCGGYGGNDEDYDQRVRLLVGYPTYDQFPTPAETFSARDSWMSRWRAIETSYVNNSWISSCFVGGPHGWCHPDGRIGFVDNIGKWPGVEAVENDWGTLARAFPFLDIGVTLMDGESCAPNAPIVSMRIYRGAVVLHDPTHTDVHAGHEPPTRGGRLDHLSEEAALIARFTARTFNEHAIPDEWIQEWADAHNGWR